MQHPMPTCDISGGSMKEETTVSRWNGQQQALVTVLLDTQLLPIVNRLLLLDDLHRHEHEYTQQ